MKSLISCYNNSNNNNNNKCCLESYGIFKLLYIYVVHYSLYILMSFVK